MNIIKRAFASFEARIIIPFIQKNYEITKKGRKIKELKNTKVGETCFIIGNGPSLKAEDLTKLNELGIDTFAANRIFKIYDKTPWRPNYFCCEDPVIIKDIEDVINSLDCKYKFIPINLCWDIGIDIKNAHYINMDYARNDEVDYGFVDELEKRVFCQGTVTLTAIQLAAYMGYKNIYMIGVDNSYSRYLGPDGQVIEDKSVRDYFDNSYDEGIKNDIVRNMDALTQGYYRTYMHFKETDVSIYNATRGGKLEVFPRIDLDEFFKNYKKEN